METTPAILRFYSFIPDQVQDAIPTNVKKLIKFGIVGRRTRLPYDQFYDSAIRDIYQSEVLPSPEIRVLDVGARYGPQSRLKVLDQLNTLRLTGVEPDKEEAEKLSAEYPNHRFTSVALSDSARVTDLFLTKHRGWSSLYEPNDELLDRFEFYDDEYEVEKTTDVETKTLDDLANDLGEDYDLIKIDTQGSDGDIISGGQSTIADCLAIEFETHFKPLYKNQPLFSDIHKELSNNGLSLIDISSGARYPRWAKHGKTSFPNPDGEIIEQHPLYLDLQLDTKEEVCKSIILTLLYRRKSVAASIVNHNAETLSDEEVKNFRDTLAEIRSPVFAKE